MFATTQVAGALTIVCGLRKKNEINESMRPTNLNPESNKKGPLNMTEDIHTDHDPSHPLTTALRNTVQQNKLTGGVMLTFSGDRVGVNSSAPDPRFGDIMERLADSILHAFHRGDFDHVLTNKNEG